MFGKQKPTPQKRIDALIGAGTTVRGDILFEGGLRVDGTVIGNITVADGKPGTLVVSESARIDGASDATVLFRIVIPLSLPALATVGLFIAVIYWNDWWHGMMLLNFAKFRPLAVILLRMVVLAMRRIKFV